MASMSPGLFDYIPGRLCQIEETRELNELLRHRKVAKMIEWRANGAKSAKNVHGEARLWCCKCKHGEALSWKYERKELRMRNVKSLCCGVVCASVSHVNMNGDNGNIQGRMKERIAVIGNVRPDRRIQRRSLRGGARQDGCRNNKMQFERQKQR